MGACVQFEISSAAYEAMHGNTDAQGNKIEVVKIPCPPPLFRTYKEAEGVAVSHPVSHTQKSCSEGSSMLLLTGRYSDRHSPLAGTGLN